MIKSLIIHQWQAATRAPIWHRKLVSNIFYGFLMSLIALNVLGLGLFMKPLQKELAPEKDPVVLFNGFLLFYFGIDLVLRFLLQKVPGQTIRPYLHLPIRKSLLVHFLLSKSIWSLFNFIPLLIFIPVAIQIIATYSALSAWIWLLIIFILFLCSSYFVTYLKRLLFVKPTVVAMIAALIVILFGLEYFEVISVSKFSALVFGTVILNPAWTIVPIVVLVFLYALNFNFLKAHTYLDRLSQDKVKEDIVGRDFAYLERFGEAGTFLSLELKLIFRTKRLKSALYISPLLLVFGFLFYGLEEYRNYNLILIYMSIFMMAMFMINYGQFIFAWEGSYFDAILSNKISIRKYLKAKLLILILSCIALFIIMTPFAYFGMKILYLNTALLFFNIGINSFILLFKSTYNRQKLDLNVSVVSMQGKDAKIIFMVLLLVIIPILIYLPFTKMGIPNMGLIVIRAVGLTGLLFYNILLRIVVSQFNKQKYNLASAFRQI